MLDKSPTVRDVVAAPEPLERNGQQGQQLVTVKEAAAILKVSESWVRRHQHELPLVRIGRLIRFDAALLTQQIHVKQSSGNRLKTGGSMGLKRYQRGYVYKTGKKKKMWYGMYREDVMKSDGSIAQRQRNVRLGSLAELPTRSAAIERLATLLRSSQPKAEMTCEELAERWRKAVGPTMKPSTFGHYEQALRAYVLPNFGKRKIAEISREDVQVFFAQQAAKYSKSSLRSMRVALSLILGWARDCGWLERNPCERVKLPRETGGRTVNRTVLTCDEIAAIVEKLEEPYATFILFLSASGLRIGEAIAIKWTDVDGNILHVARRIYDGDVDEVKSTKSRRSIPLEPALLLRMRQLGDGEWVFRSRRGTPLNPGNVLKRHVRPAAEQLRISIGGWHDFRHTLTTRMRQNGAHPKVVSGILGHSRVALAMDCYDHAGVEDFSAPLTDFATELLRSVTKSAPAD